MGESTRTRAAVGGDAVGFVSFSAFAGALGTGLTVDYVSVRESSGWKTHAATPAQDPTTADTTWVVGYQGEFSEDLSGGVFRAFSPVTDDPNVANVRNLYVRRDLRTPGGDTYELVTAASELQSSPPSIVAGVPALADASADLQSVLFESTLNLTADASGDMPKVYLWDKGVLRLAGILPDAVCGTPPCAAPNSSAGRGATGSNFSYTQGTLSSDGTRVFFSSPVGETGDPTDETQLYMRVSNSTTLRVNASEKTPPDATSLRAVFEAATPSGSKVVFTSSEQLTNTAGSGLYMYDATRPDSNANNLTLIASGNVVGVFGVGDDGAYVYFVATSQLAPGAPSSSDNLYVWHQGSVRYIGTFHDFEDTPKNATSSIYTLLGYLKASRVSPDGSKLVFTSRTGEGFTGYDHSSGCEPMIGRSCTEVYIYDALANGGAGELVCASCRPDGEPAAADASINTQVGNGIAIPSQHLNRPLSDDGRRVFFTSGEQLVPEDVNALTSDVYVYDTATRELSLLSSGRGSSGSHFLDATPSGDDVFFITRDRLVTQDQDDAYDLYDARVGGGFGEPPPAAPPCVGDGCRGSTSSGSGMPTPGSVTFTGPGNSGGVSPVFRVVPLSRRQVQRWAASGRVRLRVEVSEAGRVRVSARAQLGGKGKATVARASRQAMRGGAVRLPLRLSGAALAALRRGERVRVSIVVRYSKVLGAQRATVVLRRPTGAAARVNGRRGR